MEKLITVAREYLSSGTWLTEASVPYDSPEARQLMIELTGKVVEMERSWHQSLIGLLKLAGGFGSLMITKDGEHAPFFHQPESGLCGALVYHLAYREGKRQVYGAFSVNT